MPSLLFLSFQFAAFAYVINNFIYISTKSTLAILLRIINFCFDIIGSYGIILWCYKKRFISCSHIVSEQLILYVLW